MDGVLFNSIDVSQKEIDEIKLPKIVNKYQAPKIYKVLRKKIHEIKDYESYDTVIFITVQPILVSGSALKNAKIALWYDSLPFHQGNSWVSVALNLASRILYNNKFKRVFFLLPASEWAMRQIDCFKFPALKKIWVAPMGVDEAIWRPKKFRKREKILKVLLVGNNAEEKGYIGFFSWCYKNKKELNNIDFTVLTNDKSSALSELGEKLGLRVVRGLNHNSIQTIIQYYHFADMFFHPTKSDMMPNVLIEAAAAQLPILASDLGAIGEIVTTGVNGWLERPGDWPAFYARLIYNRDNLDVFSGEILERRASRFYDNQLRDKLSEIVNYVS